MKKFKVNIAEWVLIHSLIRRGAIFVVNHSGGKDSQAMYLMLRTIVPKEQLWVIHAHLGEVEWSGVIEHIEETIDADVLFDTCENPNKTFFTMVEHRKMFPSGGNRQCTSDLKRGPITTKTRRLAKEHGKYLIVNCMGMRAQESDGREAGLGTKAEKEAFKKAKKEGGNPRPILFQKHKLNSVAGREWYEWLPIHSLSKAEVIQIVKDNGQELHWAYRAGMSRLSCSFCIFSSKQDMAIAARLRPELYKKYVELEIKLNHTLSVSQKFLPELTGIPVN